MTAVLHEGHPNGVHVLRLNRPEARNALNLEIREALATRFRELGRDPNARAIVITGDGKTFAAGADIKALAKAGPKEVMALGYDLLWREIADCPKPVIAAVNGYALGGGCELALHADIIVAGEGATFGLPEIKIGIMPGAGGSQRLVRAMGKYRAMRLILTGSLFTAGEALAGGLVSEMVADDEVFDTAFEIASEISQLPPLAVAQIKEVMLAGADLPLSAALTLERKAMQLLFDTADQKEGMAAFLEKREAKFQGE